MNLIGILTIHWKVWVPSIVILNFLKNFYFKETMMSEKSEND
jgi:hypothetical protein